MEPTPLQPRDRIRFVTRHFHDLQGLQVLVPAGLITLGMAASFLRAPWSVLRAVPFLGALLLVLGARQYYRSRFGEIEPRQAVAEPPGLSIDPSAGGAAWRASFSSPIATAKSSLMIVGLVLPWVPLLFSFLFCPPWITMSSGEVVSEQPVPGAAWYGLASLPVPVVYLLAAFLFLGLWLVQERRLSQSHHLAFGILLGGLAFSGSSQGAALLLAGLAMISAGALDHWQLVRLLGPRRHVEEGR